MISDTIRFWSFLLVLIPSFLCSLFVLYHLLSDRALRDALNNHVIIILLFIGLIAEVTFYPWMLYFYQNKDVWERSVMFCVIWGFLDWILYVVHMLCSSHGQQSKDIFWYFMTGWLSTKKKRFFVHYLASHFPSSLFVYFLYYYVFFSKLWKSSLDHLIFFAYYPCLYEIYITFDVGLCRWSSLYLLW